MISIVLYGRNDNYGYNLHKRAALSFNCLAELLTDDNDEILFVDYNTPDDFPTFPEAIQDTLTPLAKKRLRILRVRPPIHKRFQERTRLVALEPVSRNVAVRRSNPANRWILSTNTDMVFVPRGSRTSLSDIARDLAPGFYHAPRLEIPETLWEGLDRQKPQLAIETIKEWGSTLHLNEIVLGSKTILYDGPGDFQLIQRADLFKYHGFDEEMILGWHVDSNIAKRLLLVHGNVGDLGDAVFGYHCDHTRQITPAHSHTRTENDWRRFVEDLTDPYIATQADTWGCVGDEIEEVRLSDDNTKTYVAALRNAIGAPLEKVPIATYSTESYGAVDYDPRHLLPFLGDLFVSAPRNCVLAWTGVRRETLDLFAQVWRNLGFTQPILVDENLVSRSGFVTVSGVSAVDAKVLLDRADAFVVDFGSSNSDNASNRFGGLTSAERKALGRAFLDIVEVERARLVARVPLRRIACLNAIHTPYETLVRGYVGAGLTPFATRMRHGFVLPPPTGTQNWTEELQVGEAARRSEQGICANPGATGVICYGPYRQLAPGRYQIELRISGEMNSEADPFAPIGAIELIWGAHILLPRPLVSKDIEAGRVVLEITIDPNMDPSGQLQTVVRTFVPSSIVISAVLCRGIARGLPSAEEMAGGFDWLGLLQLGPSGRWNADQHIEIGSERDYAAYGPYWTLLPGRYEARLAFNSAVGAARPFLVMEVVSDGQYRAVSFVNGTRERAGEISVSFEVHEDEAPSGELPVEIRLRSVGGAPGRAMSLNVRRIGDAIQPSPWITPPDPPSTWPFFERARALADGRLRGPLSVKIGGRTVRSILGAVARRLPIT